MVKLSCTTLRLLMGSLCSSSLVDRWLLLILAFGEEGSQPVEAALPGGAALGDPALHRLQGRALDVAGAHPPLLGRTHQAARLEDLQVLQYRGHGHVQRLRQLADRGRPAAEALHHDPPRRIGQGMEDTIDWQLLVKHLIKYYPGRLANASASVTRSVPAALWARRGLL